MQILYQKVERVEKYFVLSRFSICEFLEKELKIIEFGVTMMAELTVARHE